MTERTNGRSHEEEIRWRYVRAACHVDCDGRSMDQWERGWSTLIFRDDSSVRENEGRIDQKAEDRIRRTPCFNQGTLTTDVRRSLSLIHPLGDECLQCPVTLSICRAPTQVNLLF